VMVTAVYERDGLSVEFPVTDWIASVRDGQSLTQLGGNDRWLFAGSTMVTRGGREWYRSDGEGTLIGLTCFGSETVAWSRMFNPDSGVEDPHWIANRATVPPMGTPVVVRIMAR